MSQTGIYLSTTFADFNAKDFASTSVFNTQKLGDYVEPETLRTLYLNLAGELPQGSSHFAHISNQDCTWTIGFAGYPRLDVMINVLAIMQTNILPRVDCLFQLTFNHKQDDELNLISVSTDYRPNGNTFVQVLQFIERCQHQCY
jgi:hypothetical protein